MGQMHDHDRIEELQALVAGLLTALEAVIAGLEGVAVANPELAKPLSGPLNVARLSLRQAERVAERAAETGEARWASMDPEEMRPEPQ
jgi:hypothetical protein